MAPIPVKCIISFSSQDEKHPAENLVKGLSVLKWLGSPTDRSGRLEATFQLQTPCVLGFIDIGTVWALSLQILVGKSTWSANQEYKTLLSGRTLMSAKDCRQEQNKQKLCMFKYDEFNSETRDDSWDRIKIVLTQPFRKDRQMGVTLLRFTSKNDEINSTKEETTKSDRKPSKENVNKPFDSPGTKSGQEIEKYFFGSQKDQNTRQDWVKSKLIRIEGSGEHGVEREEAMPRHARLVMAAVSKTPVYKTVSVDSSNAPVSRSAPAGLKKRKLSFEEEVNQFLKRLKPEELDLENVTFADLRHRLEKQKKRKLSKEEKRVFFQKVEEFINNMISQEETSDKNETDRKKSSDLGASPELKSKRPSSNHLAKVSSRSRSFLSPQYSSSQNMKLYMEPTQNSYIRSSEDSSEISSNSTTESFPCSKSTQDLHLELTSPRSEKKSNNRSPDREYQRTSKAFQTQSTQDLKLQIETQDVGGATISSSSKGSDGLKLKLENSKKDPGSQMSDSPKGNSFRGKARSTIKEQRSFISQVQNCLNGAKSKTPYASSKMIDRDTPARTRAIKGNKANKSLPQVNNAVKDNYAHNDDVWLNTTGSREGMNACNMESESNESSPALSTVDSKKRLEPGGKSKGKKRTSDFLCPDEKMKNIKGESQKRRKKSKGGKKETCPNCQKSYSQKEIAVHKRLCAEFSSDSEVEDIADMSSQIDDLLAERRMKSSDGSANPYVSYADETTGNCPVCNERYEKDFLPSHVEQCIVASQQSQDVDKGQCPVCAKEYSVTALQMHVNECVDMSTNF